jgi:hypothetical protein
MWNTGKTKQIPKIVSGKKVLGQNHALLLEHSTQDFVDTYDFIF